MKVLVCGSRHWRDYIKIRDRLAKLPPDTIIVEGGCEGADLLARRAAMELGLDVVEFPANWKRYGRAAGPIRNDRMLKTGVKLIIAFHENFETSSGTKDTVTKARNLKIEVELIA